MPFFHSCNSLINTFQSFIKLYSNSYQIFTKDYFGKVSVKFGQVFLKFSIFVITFLDWMGGIFPQENHTGFPFRRSICFFSHQTCREINVFVQKSAANLIKKDRMLCFLEKKMILNKG